MKPMLEPEKERGQKPAASKKGKGADETSPKWSQTTKLVVGLTLVTITGALLVRFQNVVGPLLLAFILSYLLHPLVKRVADSTRLQWRGAVNLIYLLFLIVLISLLTVGGVALVQQLQSLVRVVTMFLNDLPELVQTLTSEPIVFVIPVVNFEIDVNQILADLNIDFLTFSQDIINFVQPALGQAGSLLGSVASSAATTLAWGFFVMIISYFVLADGVSGVNPLANIDMPGHQADLRRLGRELGRIWNAFLRGQFSLVLLTAILYFVVLTALGVRNALALALVAAAAKFLPYVGQWLTSGTIAVVTFFQTSNYFGMEPLIFTLMVMGIVLAFDQVMDNLIAPRILGSALGIHPAGLLVAVIVMASLLGFIGVLLAAPSLASAQLFLRYAFRKMVDLDPWPDPEKTLGPMKLPFSEVARSLVERLRNWWKARTRKGNDE